MYPALLPYRRKILFVLQLIFYFEYITNSDQCKSSQEILP